MRFLRAVAAVLALTGCSATMPPAATDTAAAGPVTNCSDPRPQVCAMVYDPVCATLAGGKRATYASGCNACAHAEVSSYVNGPCPE